MKGIVDDGACSLTCAFGVCLIDLFKEHSGETNVRRILLNDTISMLVIQDVNLPLSLPSSLLNERLLLRLRRDDFLSL